MCISAKVLNDQFEQKDLDKTNGATPFLAVWSIIAFCTNFAFAVLLLQSSRPEGEKFDHSVRSTCHPCALGLCPCGSDHGRRASSPQVVALAHLNFWVTMVLFGLACKQPGAKMGDGQSLGSTQKAMSGWGILACLFTVRACVWCFFLSFRVRCHTHDRSVKTVQKWPRAVVYELTLRVPFCCAVVLVRSCR